MTTLANRMGDVYRIVKVSTATANRAAGLVAMVSPDAGDGAAIEAYRRGLTLATCEDRVRELPDGRIDTTLACKVAATKFRARIIREAERAGVLGTLAMLKSVSPSDIASQVDADGGVAFGCPVLGTYAIVRDHVPIDANVVDATCDHAATMRAAAEATRARAIEAAERRQIAA